jgi:hypothetical protein
LRAVGSCAGCAEEAYQRVDRVALQRIMDLSQRGCGRGPCSASNLTRRRTKALSDRRGELRQFDLFGGNRPRSAGDTPTWSALPAEARSELIGLMRRLILEHVDRKQQNAAAEASHDL